VAIAGIALQSAGELKASDIIAACHYRRRHRHRHRAHRATGSHHALTLRSNFGSEVARNSSMTASDLCHASPFSPTIKPNGSRPR
jgi:hypothetical protein